MSPRSQTLRIALTLLFALATIRCAGLEAAAAAEPPYPPSEIIGGVEWDLAARARDAAGSDLWPLTWADDGAVYTAWGDGKGFAEGPVSSKVSYGIARLEGAPPALVGTDVGGWKGPDGRGKITGLVSARGVFYMPLLLQGGGFDYTMAWSAKRGGDFHACPRPLWRSPGEFFPSSFVNFGRDYAGARDEYLYLYGAKWIWKQGPADRVYLARVPVPSPENPAAICEPGSYEYLSGPDADGDGLFDGGTPAWSSDVGDRVAVFHDPAGVANTGIASVIHHPGLDRYILTVSHRPSGEDLMAGVGQLGIFEGPEPWGPWRTVAYEENWGGFGKGEALGYYIPTKWLGEDDGTFWMIFSSTGSLDSFNLVRGTFLRGDAGKTKETP